MSSERVADIVWGVVLGGLAFLIVLGMVVGWWPKLD